MLLSSEYKEQCVEKLNKLVFFPSSSNTYFLHSSGLHILTHKVHYCPFSPAETKKMGNMTTFFFFNLHWLPVYQRLDFQILPLGFKASNDLGPKFIFDLLHGYEPSKPLRSSRPGLLSVLRVKTKTWRGSIHILCSTYLEQTRICRSSQLDLLLLFIKSNNYLVTITFTCKFLLFQYSIKFLLQYFVS